MLHLHRTVVILFLFFFMFKSALLFAEKYALLDKIRTKTKWLEMVLGVLILATGIYLLVRQEIVQTYLIIKFILVLIAIPVGIVGLKKSNKILVIVALLLFIFIYGISQSKSALMKPRTYAESTQDVKVLGKEIYANECARCHGENGNANLYGSKDLSQTILSKEEQIGIITNGKNTMPAFKNKLTEDQVAAVTAYIEELKK